MLTRLGLYGGPRGLYGDFSGKPAASVQMSGTTGFAWTPSGALDVEATLAGSTAWDTTPTGALDVAATLSGSTGFTWTPSGNLVDTAAVESAVTPTGGWGFAHIYDRYREEKREREEEERQSREHVSKIQDPVDAEIARLLHKQIDYEARTQEIDKLESMMRQFDDRRERQLADQFNADVAQAYDLAMNSGTFASAEAFERAMERALEEEDFLMLAIATLH